MKQQRHSFARRLALALLAVFTTAGAWAQTTITESTTWADGTTFTNPITVSGGTTETPIVITVEGTVNMTGSSYIKVAPGSHVKFQGTNVETSKLDFHDRASGSNVLFNNNAPSTDGDVWIEFDALTMDFNQLNGYLCFEGWPANPMRVDFTNTVIKNTKRVGFSLITLKNCDGHFRSGTKIMNNEVGTVIEEDQSSGTPEGFSNTIYLYDGCEISGNTCNDYVLSTKPYYVNKIVMYGGTIKNNTLKNANRGVIMNMSDQVDIYGGSIQDNTSPGFVIYNYLGTLNVYGGSFTGNSGLRGGVITNKSYVDNTVTIIATTNIYDGTFTNNTASYGGAVYNHDGTLNIYGGTFNNNTATAKGSAIYSGSILNITPEVIDYTEEGDPKTSSGSLVITDNTSPNTDGGITIANGSQLFTTSAVTATIEKTITAYTSATGAGNTDGWYFIASPLRDPYTPAGTMLTNTYDLYRLNNTTWENFKNTTEHHDFPMLNNGTGYLYANIANVTLQFTGEIKPYSEEGSANQVNVSAGWNLVGNPFASNVYANRAFYKMNTTRTGIEAVEDFSANAIEPYTGIIVNAGEDGTVTFTKDAPASLANGGSLQIVLAQACTSRGVENIDNAIVSFNEGSQLEKFVFNHDHAKLYIPQDGKDYAIAYSESQGEMPLNFKASKDGTYTITVNPEGVDLNYLHLIDNVTGKDVDMLASPTYTFAAKTTDYASRFRLVFSADGDVCEPNDAPFAFINNGNIIVNGEGTLQVVDVMGRVVRCTDGACTVSTRMPAGVYVLRLIDGNNVKTQKIVIP